MGVDSSDVRIRRIEHFEETFQRRESRAALVSLLQYVHGGLNVVERYPAIIQAAPSTSMTQLARHEVRVSKSPP